MDPISVTLLSVGLVTVILSLPGNLFMIVVNLLDFCKNRRLPLSDQLTLGFSVFSLLHALQKGHLLSRHLFQLPFNSYDAKSENVLMYLIASTLWFSALLSGHFCLKIVSLNHRPYIQLQRTFPKLCPWIIVTFLLGYFFLILYSVLDTKPACLQNTTIGIVSMKASMRCSWLILIFLVICVLCSLLCSVSASAILVSLLKHMRRIQEKMEGSRSPSTEAHICAVRTIGSLLAANVLMFTSVFVLALHRKRWVYVFGSLIFVCHIFSSYFLIKGTKKLDKTLSEILSRWSCDGVLKVYGGEHAHC